MASGVFLGIIIFIVVFSFFMSELTGTTYNLLSPLTFGVIGVTLSIVVGASNTPIAKGVGMLSLFGVILANLLFSGIPLIIYGVIIVPILIGLGIAMSEIGQG